MSHCYTCVNLNSDYVLDKDRFFVRDASTEGLESFIVTYHGLLDKIKIAEVNSEKKAQEMCLQHNKSVPEHWFNAGLGHMSYVKKNKEKEIKC